MADDKPDLLSQLPDELLQHILHLAPCREAQTTAVLSRRWLGLWPLLTGAVKIDMPSGDNWQEVIAVAAAHGPVRRLAIAMATDAAAAADDGCRFDEDIAGHVLSHPACRGVEDVRIGEAAGDGDDDEEYVWRMPMVSWDTNPIVGVFQLSLGVVPSAALRVLHISNCRNLMPPPPPPASSSSSTFFFPCLEVLRLRRCKVSLNSLQDMVVASPQLAALQLEYVYLATSYANSLGHTGQVSNAYYMEHFPRSLCCPSVTTLVIVNCRVENVFTRVVPIELDVPRVQHFRFRGMINEFTLRSPLPDVRRAYLHFLVHDSNVQTCQTFWNLLKNFSEAKVLKLKLAWQIGHVALMFLERRIADMIRETLFNVEHLEIDAPYNAQRVNVGEAIGNLLQCCPSVHDLRLKLTIADPQPWRKKRKRSTSLPSKAQLEFHKSFDNFRRRRDNTDTVVPLVYGEEGKFEASDIPGLSDRWFHLSCLQNHLKRLSLQFHMDKDNPDCVGVRLIKFFVERGMALEEMYIDDGNMKLWEHMNCKISGYAANPEPFPEYNVLQRMSQALSMNQFSSSKISGWFQSHKLQVRRTHPCSTSTRFTILPLEIND